jgi:hypothetical protein
MTLRTVLLSLQALLSAAEPDDPQDAVVAKQYKEKPDMFCQTAKHWTSVYAGGKFSISFILRFLTIKELIFILILYKYIFVFINKLDSLNQIITIKNYINI